MNRLLTICCAVLLVMGTSCRAAGVDQTARWNAAKLDPRRAEALNGLVDRWNRTRASYLAVTKMKANGVPAVIAFCLFYRESDNDFACSPAQGDPLTHRSRNEPANRIPGKSPPYKWADAAFDAYYVCDKLDQCQWSEMQSALDKMESFNGFGYRSHGIAAPYLWSGTTAYTRGKYVSDGRFDRLAVDQQVGVAAILLRMKERGTALPF